MDKEPSGVQVEGNGEDRLFLIAESLAEDFSLFARQSEDTVEDHVRGLLAAGQIQINWSPCVVWT